MGMVIWPDLPWRAFEGSQPIMPMETGRLVETDRLEPSLAHTIDGTSTARLARFEQRVLQCGRAMPIPTFRLLSLQQPVGQGATGARYVGVQGVAKEHRAGSYTVVNEWVAAELARPLPLHVRARGGRHSARLPGSPSWASGYYWKARFGAGTDKRR